jgi:hypothetical protein
MRSSAAVFASRAVREPAGLARCGEALSNVVLAAQKAAFVLGTVVAEELVVLALPEHAATPTPPTSRAIAVTATRDLSLAIPISSVGAGARYWSVTFSTWA